MISHARGFSGTPNFGHCSSRRDQRFLHGVFGGGEVAEALRQNADDLRSQRSQEIGDMTGAGSGFLGSGFRVPGSYAGSVAVNQTSAPGTRNLGTRNPISAFQRNSGGGPLMTSRTSIAMFSGAPPGPGAAEAAAAIAYARPGVSTSTIQ